MPEKPRRRRSAKYEALEAAIRNWRGEPAVPHAHEEGKLVCKCFGIISCS